MASDGSRAQDVVPSSDGGCALFFFVGLIERRTKICMYHTHTIRTYDNVEC